MVVSEKPVVIVTGASRGIGKAIALMFVKKNYIVIGLYRSSDDAAEYLNMCGIDMRKANAGKKADVASAIDYVVRTYGRIDIVINNAGIGIFGDIETYPKQSWDTMVETNLTSIFLLSKYTIPYLKNASNPCIINISSRRSIDEYAEPNFVVYSSLKAALNNFTVGLAKELKDFNIRVNCIVPTPTKTDLFDQVFSAEDEALLKTKGKLGSTDEVADLVLRLIRNTSMNGQILFDERLAL